MPASDEATPTLPGLSPICGRPIVARFDGAQLSSDGGLLVLREVEQRLGIARRLAGCIVDRALRSASSTGSTRSSASAC